MQKSKLEIINETVEFYGSDPSRRAASPSGSCFYLEPGTGNKCAVGRCLIDPSDLPNDTTVCGLMGDERLTQESFLPEYRGHDAGFWRNLQFLHDAEGHFDKSGITELGTECADRLRTTYANG